MKTVILCLIAVLTTCTPSTVSRFESGKERTIAVPDLTSLGLSKYRTNILSETLRGEIERSLLEKRNLRYKLLTSSTVEHVDMIGIGYAGYLGTTSSIGVRVVEIETGRIVAAANCQRKGTGDKNLTKLVKEVSVDLVKSLYRESSRFGKISTAQQSPLYSIAVLELEAGGLSETEKKVLSEKLRSSVLKEIEKWKSQYILVERARMDIVIKAQTGKNKGECSNRLRKNASGGQYSYRIC